MILSLGERKKKQYDFLDQKLVVAQSSTQHWVR